jgi:hypothetical protein
VFLDVVSMVDFMENLNIKWMMQGGSMTLESHIFGKGEINGG